MISHMWRNEEIPAEFKANDYKLYYKMQEIAHIEYFLVYFKTEMEIRAVSTPFVAEIL